MQVNIGDSFDDSADPRPSNVGERISTPSDGLRYTPLAAAAAALPDLCADMNAIKDRVLGRRGATASGGVCTPGENREVYEELQSRHQVDLDVEANVSALEDPNLIAHMETARARLAEHNKLLAAIPHREVLRTSYLKAMGGLSSLIREVDENNKTESGKVETGFQQARALSGIAFGKTPIADSGTKEAIRHASKKVDEVAKSYESHLKTAETYRRALFSLRCEFETFGDGILKLVEFSEEERRRLRELLALKANARGGPRCQESPY